MSAATGDGDAAAVGAIVGGGVGAAVWVGVGDAVIEAGVAVALGTVLREAGEGAPHAARTATPTRHQDAVREIKATR